MVLSGSVTSPPRPTCTMRPPGRDGGDGGRERAAVARSFERDVELALVRLPGLQRLTGSAPTSSVTSAPIRAAIASVAAATSVATISAPPHAAPR